MNEVTESVSHSAKYIRLGRTVFIWSAWLSCMKGAWPFKKIFGRSCFPFCILSFIFSSFLLCFSLLVVVFFFIKWPYNERAPINRFRFIFLYIFWIKFLLQFHHWILFHIWKILGLSKQTSGCVILLFPQVKEAWTFTSLSQKTQEKKN